MTNLISEVKNLGLYSKKQANFSLLKCFLKKKSEEQDKLILDVGTKMTIKFVWSTENKNQYYVSEEDEKVSIGHVFIG